MSTSHSPRPATGERRRGREPAPERERSPLDFELAHNEIEQLLEALDHGLWKHGLSGSRLEPDRARIPDEAAAHQARRRATILAGAMTRGLQTRIRHTVDTCAALSAEQRTGLAGLLRLPQGRRQTVAALLRLPGTQRRALEVVFALSDDECAAFAQFLHPTTEPAAEPTLTIIDPSLAAEDMADSTNPA